jgi:hypothetical protein
MMPRKLSCFRTIVLVMLLAYLQSIFLPAVLMGQTVDCQFDPNAPDLEHARQNFKALNYVCAEQEINALINLEGIDIEEKANAHVLMAAVYYAKLRDSKEKEQKVVEEFARAFRSYQTWQGDLDIKSREFMGLMEKARQLVDEEKLAAEQQVDTVAVTPIPKAGGKPWYKQWWAIGLGVGLVVGVVAVAAGGGGGEPDNSLPGFPPPPPQPAKQKDNGE